MKVLEKVRYVSFLQERIYIVDGIFEIKNMMMELQQEKSGVGSFLEDVITKQLMIYLVKTVKIVLTRRNFLVNMRGVDLKY